MPQQSITHYVSISVALGGTGVQPAGFGVPIFVSDHTVTANRLDGPYTSLAGLVDDGFDSESEEYAWASAVLAQQPRVTSFYIGRRDSGDATLAASMDAILAVNPGAWYAINLASRTDADIAAIAAWVETQRKIAVVQSDAASLIDGTGARYSATFGGTPADGTYRLTFTGFGLGSPVNVDVVRSAGSPATNANLGTALRAALLSAADGGSLDGVVDVDSLGGTSATATFQIVGGLAAAGTVSVTDPESPNGLVVTVTDNAIGELLQRNGYTRCALFYHSDDADYADGALTSRCLAFDLDTQKGAWSYKRLIGVEGDALSDTEVANLRNVNANYYASAVMSSGVAVQAFTAQGWMPAGDAGAGRRIDVTTSLDWLHARLEEAVANVLLRETHEIPYTDAGINRFAAAIRGVFATGLKAGHLVEFTVPEGEENEGIVTPYLDLPRLSDTTTTQRQNRTLTASGLVYLRSAIERVVFALSVSE